MIELRKCFVPKESFKERFDKLAKNIPEEELAGMFSVSKTTIRRWRAGTSSPHPIMQKMVFKILTKK